MKENTTMGVSARHCLTGLAGVMLLAGCGSPTGDGAAGTGAPPAALAPTSLPPTAESAATGGFGDGYGASAGAQEVSEPALGLLVIDDTGAVGTVELATGSAAPLADVDAPRSVWTDGRYAFVTTATGLTVVDGGSWTVPHGDHSHYYSLPPRVVGDVPGVTGSPGHDTGPRVATGTTAVTVFSPVDGRTTVLDAEALGDGAISVSTTIPGPAHRGLAVPLGDLVVRTVPDGSGVAARVEVVDAQGAVVDAGAACPAAEGTFTTRVGVVVGCADGAVLISESGGAATGSGEDPAARARASGTVTVEHLALPAPVDPADRPVDLHARKDRPVVAARTGDGGAWVLDTRAREWSRLRSDTPLVRVTAAGDRQASVVAVDRSGRIVVLDGRTGNTVARTDPLLAASVSDPALAAGVTIEIDADRAYVNDPAGARVLEIDYRDGARVAREFVLPTRPVHLVEVGR